MAAAAAHGPIVGDILRFVAVFFELPDYQVGNGGAGFPTGETPGNVNQGGVGVFQVVDGDLAGLPEGSSHGVCGGFECIEDRFVFFFHGAAHSTGVALGVRVSEAFQIKLKMSTRLYFCGFRAMNPFNARGEIRRDGVWGQ